MLAAAVLYSLALQQLLGAVVAEGRLSFCIAGLDIRTNGAKKYIVDGVHQGLDFTETIEAIERFRAMHPGCSGVFIERAANGAAAIATLTQWLPGSMQ